MNQHLIIRYASTVERIITDYQLCGAGIAHSPFVLAEHISNYSCCAISFTICA